MTKKYIAIYLILISITMLMACENEISFNQKIKPPRLIMNAFINADSTNNILYLNLSGQNIISDVKDATIEVRVNEMLVEKPHPIEDFSTDKLRHQKKFLITHKFNAGETVRIDAKTNDGIHHAWAEVIVPQAPNLIEKIDTATVPYHLYDSYYESKLRFRITFTDRVNEKNYYRFILDRKSILHAYLPDEKKDTIVMVHNYSMAVREDMVLTDGHPSISDNDNDMFEQANNIYGVFDDNRIYDQTYTMTVYMGENKLPYIMKNYIPKKLELECYVRLLSINEIDFKYLKTLNIIDSDIYDSTMMEPITFASNVNGGLGLVGISTETCFKINLPSVEYDYSSSN